MKNKQQGVNNVKKTSKHKDKLSGLNKWSQIKNRHELFELDYINQLTDSEKLVAFKF